MIRDKNTSFGRVKIGGMGLFWCSRRFGGHMNYGEFWAVSKWIPQTSLVCRVYHYYSYIGEVISNSPLASRINADDLYLQNHHWFWYNQSVGMLSVCSSTFDAGSFELWIIGAGSRPDFFGHAWWIWSALHSAACWKHSVLQNAETLNVLRWFV